MCYVLGHVLDVSVTQSCVDSRFYVTQKTDWVPEEIDRSEDDGGLALQLLPDMLEDNKDEFVKSGANDGVCLFRWWLGGRFAFCPKN